MSSQDQQLYVPSYKNHCFLREVKDGTDAIMDVIDDNMDKLGDGAYLLICNALRDMRKHMETRTPAQIDTIRRREARAREAEAERLLARVARRQTSQALQHQSEAELARALAIQRQEWRRMNVLSKVVKIFDTYRRWFDSRPEPTFLCVLV